MKASDRAKIEWSPLEDAPDWMNPAQRQAWADIVAHAGRLREWNTGHVIMAACQLAELRAGKKFGPYKLRLLRGVLTDLGLSRAARNRLAPRS